MRVVPSGQSFERVVERVAHASHSYYKGFREGVHDFSGWGEQEEFKQPTGNAHQQTFLKDENKRTSIDPAPKSFGWFPTLFAESAKRMGHGAPLSHGVPVFSGRIDRLLSRQLAPM
jgi:hypothetical protein